MTDRLLDGPSDAWRPEQYERFRAQRARPFHDLLAMVRPGPVARALDLGCGTGELTAHMHSALGARTTVGVDRSERMLSRCDEHAAPGLSFRRADIAAFDERPWDLVLSNAALHWLGDHPALLARLASMLAPGGQLAIQVPAMHDRPTHRVAAEVAAEAPFREALGGFVVTYGVMAPAAYARALRDLGFEEQRVRLEVYGHELPGREHVVEWVKGSLLTGYERRLDGATFERFLARYRERLFEELPDERPFFFPFERILLWARRP